jgi:hypothetical protein
MLSVRQLKWRQLCRVTYIGLYWWLNKFYLIRSEDKKRLQNFIIYTILFVVEDLVQRKLFKWKMEGIFEEMAISIIIKDLNAVVDKHSEGFLIGLPVEDNSFAGVTRTKPEDMDNDFVSVLYSNSAFA